MSMDINYYAFNERRADQEWAKFYDTDLEKGFEDDTVESHVVAWLLFKEPRRDIDRKSILRELLKLDLDYGSDRTSIEEPKLEEGFRKLLFRLFVPEVSPVELESGTFPSDDKFVLLFQRINRDTIDQALNDPSAAFAMAIDLDEDNKEWYPRALLEYAVAIRPIVKDIKEHGSRLFVTFNDDFAQDASLVRSRAEEHLARLLEKYPGLKDRLR